MKTNPEFQPFHFVRLCEVRVAESYPAVEGPRGCEAGFAAARAGVDAAAGSSGPEPGLTLATLLACSVWKQEERRGQHYKPRERRNARAATPGPSALPCPCINHVQRLTFWSLALALPEY